MYDKDLPIIVVVMADDDMATQEAKASATMIFTMMNQIDSLSAR